MNIHFCFIDVLLELGDIYNLWQSTTSFDVKVLKLLANLKLKLDWILWRVYSIVAKFPGYLLCRNVPWEEPPGCINPNIHPFDFHHHPSSLSRCTQEITINRSGIDIFADVYHHNIGNYCFAISSQYSWWAFSKSSNIFWLMVYSDEIEWYNSTKDFHHNW